jgi:hypothetical protein
MRLARLAAQNIRRLCTMNLSWTDDIDRLGIFENISVFLPSLILLPSVSQDISHFSDTECSLHSHFLWILAVSPYLVTVAL